MWTIEKVDATLKAYKTDYGMYLHKSVEASRLNQRLARAHHDLIDDLSAVQAQVITDMPRGGNKTNSKVEEAAVKVADGWMTEEMRELTKQVEVLNRELDRLQETVEYVQAWLAGLTEREKWIIVHQFINEETWDNVMSDYQRLFGRCLSKDTLKRLKARALERIYEAAEVE